MKRRHFLRNSLYLCSMPLLAAMPACKRHTTQKEQTLLDADANGVRLARGFTSRIIARSGSPVVSGSSYYWHDAPDGGAVFSTADGGWIYVSNSEINASGGGVGAIRFNVSGDVIDAYSILSGTSRNCAGGASLWDTWLSCEEVPDGQVWECDIYGQKDPVVRPALGVFNHEAVAIDPDSKYLYLTEDRRDGGFYRYVANSMYADGKPDLENGQLQIAVVDQHSRVSWATLPDPSASSDETRFQIAESTSFNGGEGIVYHSGVVSFTTKGDDRVWAYDVMSQNLTIVYDAATHPNPILTGVDNITVSSSGELLVSEDGGDLQIVMITADNRLYPVMQMQGHDLSEITGPAFSPDGTRMYFSSQRGSRGLSSDGMTFEISGPFDQMSS